jgi:hypothetical protein
MNLLLNLHLPHLVALLSGIAMQKSALLDQSVNLLTFSWLDGTGV